MRFKIVLLKKFRDDMNRIPPPSIARPQAIDLLNCCDEMVKLFTDIGNMTQHFLANHWEYTYDPNSDTLTFEYPSRESDPSRDEIYEALLGAVPRANLNQYIQFGIIQLDR